MLILLTRTTKTATGTQFWKSCWGSAATLWKEFPSLQPRLRNGTATSGTPWQSAHSKPRYPLLWQVLSFHKRSDDGFNETLQVTLSVLYFNLWEKCLLLKLPTENQNLQKECRALFVQHLLNSNERPVTPPSTPLCTAHSWHPRLTTTYKGVLLDIVHTSFALPEEAIKFYHLV